MANSYFFIDFRISEPQVEFLMDIHENELLGRPPISPNSTRLGKKLIKNGLVSIRTFMKKDKAMMAYFITPLGIQFLEYVINL